MTNTRIGGKGRIPLYRQVETELLRQIQDQELHPGQQLPTEPELAAEWGVNRLTIRQAISELARAGAVVVRQGAGTYVAEPPLVIELDLPAMPSTDADAGSTASIAEYVQQDQTETLIDVTDQDTTRAVKEALGVEPPFVRIDTLVRTGQQPYLVSSYWLELRRFPDLAGLLADRLALFQTLQERYDLRLRHSWRSLAASLASTDDAALLEIPPGSAVMLREGVNIDETHTPTIYLRRRVRGDRIRFTMHYDHE